jgi:hypothetical protein
VDYHHADPPFESATAHRAEGIALLCPQHHAEVTRGWVSAAAIAKASARPKCKELGFSFGDLEGGDQPPALVFAGQTITGCLIPIQVRGVPLFSVEPPEEPGAPYLFSGNFFDAAGNPILEIQRNEWRAHAQTWDVEASGGRITVRTAPREIALQVQFVPGHAVVVERIAMHVQGYYFEGGPDTLKVRIPDGGQMNFTGGMISNCRVGFAFG